jgi:DNA-binding GntR family transcriptional regulator
MVRPLMVSPTLGKAAATYEHLKTLILTGQLKPERRLAPQDLGPAFGVSQTPMREALPRLATEGLVEWRMGQGYYSKGFSLSEQIDLAVTSQEFLMTVMRRSRGSRPKVLLQSLSALTGASIDEPDGAERVARMAEEMYVGLAEASGNTVLASFTKNVIDRTYVVRRMDLQDRWTGEMSAMALGAIGRALLTEDVESAQRIGREILENRLVRMAGLVKMANRRASAAKFP